MLRRVFLSAVVLALTALPVRAQQDVPVIVAASDLQFAVAEIAENFTKQTRRDLKLTFGSSGNFARQIQQGAPFQMYLSADEQFVFNLAGKGLTLDRGTLYAIGRIVIMVPHGSPLKADGTLADLKAGLADGRVTKFSIANPEHAPYGARAVEALRHAGLWDALKSRLVLGENVSQAAQFATSGGAQGGIIAYSLVLSPAVSKLGNYALIDDRWHEPLRQQMVLLKNAGETARLFYAYMQSPPARAIMRKYGFVLPGESS
ncbi:MAG: molybdate ABC transporter substrate-binding protein [Alphaproteobacteria bacterium]|nr:molybdate ABC transporter substrate-binding protein [Alphaproteobacteria bacterium]